MLFKNIPKRLIARISVITLTWSVLNVLFLKILSNLIKEYSDSNPSIAIIAGYFGFLILWEVLEYIGDVTQETVYAHIGNNIKMKILFNKSNKKNNV